MKWIELTPTYPKGEPGEFDTGTFHIPIAAIELIHTHPSPHSPTMICTGKSSHAVDDTIDEIKAKIDEAMK